MSQRATRDHQNPGDGPVSTARKIDINAFIAMAERTVAQAKETLTQKAASLVERPEHTMTWGESIFFAAAIVDVYEPLIRTATETRDEGKDTDAYFNAILNGIVERIIRKSASPKRSTSACANLMDQEILRAYAELAEMLRAPYMHSLVV
jgi:hypothetical protein